MRFFNTFHWAHTPRMNTSFRIGYTYWKCHFRIGPYILAKEFHCE